MIIVLIMVKVKELLWFYRFRIFYQIKHPQFTPLKILRRLVRIFERNKNLIPNQSLVPKIVPKKIWIFWAQGWDNAPPLCKLCRDSWIVNNPDWEIISLSEKDIFKYVTLDYSLKEKNITYTNYANILRVGILSKHGGVWADPTTFCNIPLNNWLPFLMQSGFFAFGKPKTTVADWFLSSEKNNVLMQCWEKYVNLYWKFAKKEGCYFWPHYLFEYMVRNNAKVRNIWLHTPRISSDGPYAVQRFLKQEGNSPEECIEMLFDQKFPVHKLDWRIEISDVILNKIKSRLNKN